MLMVLSGQPTRRALFYFLLLVVTAGVALFALLIPVFASLSNRALEVGHVATQDILAPQPITYESEVLTEQQRAAAARAVPRVFTQPDTSIARRQLDHLRSALAYINSVRSDAFSTPEQKLADLAALEHFQLRQETAENLLALSESRWQAVQQEAIVVLEQVMRTSIREDRLDDVRRTVPTLVSLSLPEEQADIVAELVAAFVAPNSLYSEELTEAARQEAREAVQPVTRSFIAGETVVQRGQVISETDLEALQALGLVQPRLNWKDAAGAATLVLLTMAVWGFYLYRNSRLREDFRGLALIAGLFLAFLVVARLLIPGHAVVPYLIPIAAYSLIIAILFGPEPALISSLPLAVLAAYDLSNALELTLYYSLGSIFGMLTLGRAHRVTSFFWSGMAVAVSGAALVLSFHLPQPNTDWISIAMLMGASLVNGVVSAGLSILLQYFLAQFLGLTTALQLMELSRPDHPLLQLILRNAPGTYQHSLQVANLAEQAAERIGADPLLTRVGALYHDVGKAQDPIFYIENQPPGSLNPHDNLDPRASAHMILRHISEGVALARKYRLPSRIQDFILEHHGTMITHYQYVKAVDEVNGEKEKVDLECFRYPGPRPRSRETAILMLADSCEARMRADHPRDERELRSLIKSVIDQRVRSGQLDETDLTLRDLDMIADSFTATLKGVYHPRIQYPQLESVAKPTPAPEEDLSPKTVPAARPSPDVPVRPYQTESPSSKA